MVLEGVVTNVAAFGAFVDVGVHQDGLVHVSAMSRDFVSDPREVVKPGDVVRVKVLSVDIPRQRIALSMRLDDEPGGQPGGTGRRRRIGRPGGTGRAGAQPARGPARAGSAAGRRRHGRRAAPRGPGRRTGQGNQGPPVPLTRLAGLPAVRAAGRGPGRRDDGGRAQPAAQADRLTG